MCLVRGHMRIQTRFLRLSKPAVAGEMIDGWQVSWVGGWGRCKVFFVVMVIKEPAAHGLTNSVIALYRPLSFGCSLAPALKNFEHAQPREVFPLAVVY